MWQEYFKVIKLKPGRVVTALFGELDFRNPDLPLHKIQELYENDFPYLAITPKGLEVLYGTKPESPKPTLKAKAKKPKAKSK
jgi:hypothetical protein